MARSTARNVIGLSLVLVICGAIAVMVFSPLSPLSSRGGNVLSTILGAADELQQWVGKQLLAIANDHLGPELAFERIDYAPPGTVTLTRVTLDDGGTRLLEAEAIRITLAETPKKGEPIIIQSVELSRPVITIAQSAGGRIAGFDRLVQSNGGARHADGGSTRLRDVFDIRKISVANAAINYTQPNAPVMRLDGLHADLDTAPAEGTEGTWYTIECSVGRDPIGSLTIDGMLDLDALVLELAGYEFDANLSPGEYDMMPPSLQVLLTDHDVRGSINAQGSGTLALRDLGASNLSMLCTFGETHMLLGAYRVDVREGKITAAMGTGGLTIQSATFKAFEGDIQLAGQVGVSGDQAYSATVTAAGVNVAQLSAAGPSEGSSRFEGILAGQCRVSGKLRGAENSDRLGGEGSFEIAQAQLARIPVIDGLLKAMKKISTVGERNDRGHGQFELHEKRLFFSTFEFISQSVAARGEGDVHFDGALDLKVNAGPLERIQGALGKVGDIFGKITDKLVSYRITGTIDQPKYAVEPLGFKLKVPFVGGKESQTE